MKDGLVSIGVMLALLGLIWYSGTGNRPVPVQTHFQQEQRAVQMPQRLWECIKKVYNNPLTSSYTRSTTYTIIDFSMPKTSKRLWVVNAQTGQVYFNTYAAQGHRFSNAPNSKGTSIGVYRTAETYIGKHGLSLKLDGLERGWNDNARQRSIVVHPANYVRRGGRSWGCPALTPEDSRYVINTIKNGTILIAYYPNSWSKTSKFLN